MSKAKTASKNNPTSREQAKEYFYNGQKIKPVKFISGKSSFLAAEYDVSGDLVVGSDGKALPWGRAKI
ncbi:MULTISPECIES: hypothetical protein [Rickettsieae]|jgi:hypothetical protein|uniref:hypothetical protein n=1 Tax=Rickettsieae TaxID=33988 RepID=UPI000B9A1E6A|nr:MULTISPECIES: hypothetical protein [unclassified Rickettsia]MDN3030238.1 hypothetical protein [Candidatus Tisiphia sp.]OZG32190.1 hypothetical protein RiCNE_03800 [Rickettsia endosymbiont of Culicoides newsteadi]